MDATEPIDPPSPLSVDALLSGTPPSLTLEPRPAAALSAQPTPAPGALRYMIAAAPLPPPRRRLLEGLALLWHDHWDLAHGIAQSHEGQADHDLLHAILHRREGDYANAGYWFRSAGRHPCLARMGEAVSSLLPSGDPLREALMPSGQWSAKAFIEEVRRHAGSSDANGARDALIRAQAAEFRVFAEWLLAG